MSRDYLRASERTNLEVKVDFEVDDMTYSGVSRNISAGGIFVATRDLRRVGDMITLRFSLPGTNQPLTVQAEVRWSREDSSRPNAGVPAGMGLRFVNPSENDVAALEEFLARRDALMGDED